MNAHLPSIDYYGFMDKADLLVEKIGNNFESWICEHLVFYFKNFTILSILLILAGIIIGISLFKISRAYKRLIRRLDKYEKKLEEEDKS